MNFNISWNLNICIEMNLPSFQLPQPMSASQTTSLLDRRLTRLAKKNFLCFSDHIFRNSEKQSRVWHSYGFWHKRISEYIRMKSVDTDEYLNIFVFKFWYKQISEWIFEYSNIFVTLWIRLAPVLCFYNLCSIFIIVINKKSISNV